MGQKKLRDSSPGCRTYAGPTETVTWNNKTVTRRWEDGPNECQFPFWYQGEEYTECTMAGGVSQPWCATVVKDNVEHKPEMVPGMWGYCGDCTSHTAHTQCEAGGHTVLSEQWRKIGGPRTGDQDDYNLELAWSGSKYQEPIIPSQHSGEEPLLLASALEAPVLD